ncbi:MULTISPECIES: type II toxin-antitoxin system VapC family toxin [Chromobacterium]|uniref:Ribonuclease VapC n=2 Tax=Chromobacterium TaxID=535 RepID=A0ABS3GH44_9NEIS|nr:MULTISPECIES: type II toxin-antitoxin system VapC family toxin [Chromobacterium]AXT48433.1 type II toxin-antitoxin system VapC family toxin [Chromobacterium rhizoryzae]MBK0412797.1 type II toxin-antitoxin system VapC family toxin [Chromobacterium haemolyticum]MBO0413899.1 type II toxin-antitoxin system VapC family toxin [Chromobacterium haemolyticum]MBO0497159.1 type II toxin-antitoxin system VapC family toxin [Chromobacterium haemolyticum]OQS32672.1 PIN domain-containing protein [Chromobac
MYLVDTNIVSEARKGGKANAGVLAFWRSADADSLYLSAISVGEIRRGIENLKHRGDLKQAGLLEQWLDTITQEFSQRILNFDADCAQVWGKLMSPHPQNAVDKQIAAIALIHDLTIVTRNSGDFAGTGVKLLNPFNPI